MPKKPPAPQEQPEAAPADDPIVMSIRQSQWEKLQAAMRAWDEDRAKAAEQAAQRQRAYDERKRTWEQVYGTSEERQKRSEAWQQYLDTWGQQTGSPGQAPAQQREAQPAPMPAAQKKRKSAKPADSSLAQLLTVEQAAARLNLGRTFVYRMVRRDEILSVKVGRRRLIPAHAVESYAKSLEEGACHDVATVKEPLRIAKTGVGKPA